MVVVVVVVVVVAVVVRCLWLWRLLIGFLETNLFLDWLRNRLDNRPANYVLFIVQGTRVVVIGKGSKQEKGKIPSPPTPILLKINYPSFPISPLTNQKRKHE